MIITLFLRLSFNRNIVIAVRRHIFFCKDNSYTINENGVPCCPHDPSLPMKREGSKSHLKSKIPTLKFVCPEDTPVLQAFLNNRVKEFSTKKKLRFVYQILYRIAVLYQSDLRIIDKMRTEIEERVGDDTEEVDLIALHELESTLVYFATSLRANGVVLDRLTRYKRLEQYPEDKELLGDVIVENKQAIEMTGIYRDIINGTRELLSSVIDNRMNSIMKSLTVITLIMAIPTVVSGIYGMNVDSQWVPFAHVQNGFGIICGIIVIICVLIFIFLRKKRIF